MQKQSDENKMAAVLQNELENTGNPSEQPEPARERENAGKPPKPLSKSEREHKVKVIQQQLVLLLHASGCQWREIESNTPNDNCPMPHCRTMKNILKHISSCPEEESCSFAHCITSKQIINHWKHCSRRCSICIPFTIAINKQKQILRDENAKEKSFAEKVAVSDKADNEKSAAAVPAVIAEATDEEEKSSEPVKPAVEIDDNCVSDHRTDNKNTEAEFREVESQFQEGNR